MFENHAAQSEAKMRNVIFAINTTLDGCCDLPNSIPMKKRLSILRTSREVLTHSSTVVKLIN